MIGNKVEEKDLIGQIKDFPIEIVQRMVDIQIEQGNNPDVSVFQRKKDTYRQGGGFQWSRTIEGTTFWSNIFNKSRYEDFFKRYPKETKEELIKGYVELEQIVVPTEGDIPTKQGAIPVGTRVIVKVPHTSGTPEVERVYLGFFPEFYYPYMVAMDEEEFKSAVKGRKAKIAVNFVPEILDIAPPKYVELTLKDISEGKGVGIDPSLIKII
jgi:hypothetical protein